MPDHAGFAAAITVREHVLRTALQAAYANGSDSSKTFVEDLSGDGFGIVPNLFLSQPDINCEGATNLLVATFQMWGPVTGTLDGVTGVVDIVGEMELTITPTFTTGPTGTDLESSLVLDVLNTAINARRWTATVTSGAAPPEIISLVTGDSFRARFEETFRLGFLVGRVSLPSIDASFLGPLARKATTVDARVRNGVLLIGLNYTDDTHTLNGDLGTLQDFARSNDVAAVVHPHAVDVLLDDLHTRLVEGVADEGATLDSFSVRARNGYFDVSGAASKSSGSVNFSFHIVRSMYHTRSGAYLASWPDSVRVDTRTWPALEFRIEDVHTDVDRSWWVIVFGEVIVGILTVGLSILYIESMASAAASGFSGKIKAAKPGAPAARVRRTIPPPGGIGVRIGLDEFEITQSGVFIGISVLAKPSPGALSGPAKVPATYRGDDLRYILRPPAGVASSDPALRIRWTLQDRTSGAVLRDEDGPAAGRMRFEFSPASFSADDFGITARLHRQLGGTESDLETQSVDLHIGAPLPPAAYVRWRTSAWTPQVTVEEATDTWAYRNHVWRERHSEWHRLDAPCRAVNPSSSMRHQIEHADRLPFSLRLLEDHRKGLCPYCFFGGPAGINANL